MVMSLFPVFLSVPVIMGVPHRLQIAKNAAVIGRTRPFQNADDRIRKIIMHLGRRRIDEAMGAHKSIAHLQPRILRHIGADNRFKGRFEITPAGKGIRGALPIRKVHEVPSRADDTVSPVGIAHTDGKRRNHIFMPLQRFKYFKVHVARGCIQEIDRAQHQL